jgi:serine/threonine protein kinase
LFIGKIYTKNRDLKPANIMMRDNFIKLGDFGLAKRCRNKRIKIDSSVGSPLYMSL